MGDEAVHEGILERVEVDGVGEVAEDAGHADLVLGFGHLEGVVHGEDRGHLAVSDECLEGWE